MFTFLPLVMQLAKLHQYIVIVSTKYAFSTNMYIGGTFLAAQKLLVQTHGQKNSKAVF
jgi:hypothetical protein